MAAARRDAVQTAAGTSRSVQDVDQPPPSASAAYQRPIAPPPAPASSMPGASGRAVSSSSARPRTARGTPAAACAARVRRRVATDSAEPTASPARVITRPTPMAAAARSIPVM
ncbi:hypothetical protein ACFQZ0_13805 [Streptomyces erythrogriseus]